MSNISLSLAETQSLPAGMKCWNGLRAFLIACGGLETLRTALMSGYLTVM
jgi:hypothetical protein